MLSSFSIKLLSLTCLSVIGGSIVINSKTAFWAEPSTAVTPAAIQSSSSVEAIAQPQAQLAPNSGGRSLTCNSYPNRQCLTP